MYKVLFCLCLLSIFYRRQRDSISDIMSTLKVFFICGVIALCLVVLVFAIHQFKQSKAEQEPNIGKQLNRGNSSECHIQFDLEDNIRMSLCYLKENNRLVDIRLFINEKPTIKGIQLTAKQWQNLMTYVELVNETIQQDHRLNHFQT